MLRVIAAANPSVNMDSFEREKMLLVIGVLLGALFREACCFGFIDRVPFIKAFQSGLLRVVIVFNTAVILKPFAAEILVRNCISTKSGNMQSAELRSFLMVKFRYTALLRKF
jgi:hypothetical protein